MGIHAVGKAADGIGPKIWLHADDSVEVSLVEAQVEIVGGRTRKDDPALISVAFTTLLQAKVDVRYPRTDLWPGDTNLPVDHPNREPDPVQAADPATERVFWEGANVVERVAVVTVVHDGTEYVVHQRSL